MSLVIKFYFTSSVLNMFPTLILPSSGACDFSRKVLFFNYHNDARSNIRNIYKSISLTKAAYFIAPA